MKDNSGPLLSEDLWNDKGKERKVVKPGIEPRASGLSRTLEWLLMRLYADYCMRLLIMKGWWEWSFIYFFPIVVSKVLDQRIISSIVTQEQSNKRGRRKGGCRWVSCSVAERWNLKPEALCLTLGSTTFLSFPLLFWRSLDSNGPDYLWLDDLHRSSDCEGVSSIRLPMLWLRSPSFQDYIIV